MGCINPSVQDAADKSKKAQKAIDDLHNSIQANSEKYKSKFDSLISSHLSDAKITDGTQIGFQENIKTEFASQFSLDKIAGVITKALDALKAAKDPTVPAPAISPNAIDAYKTLVNTVAEAAKSSSSTASSLSFSMNRLTPGIYVFLYSFSENIKDTALFGNETVTSTAIYYEIVQSLQDLKNEAAFGATVIDKKNYLNAKTIQASLMDSLADGSIDINEWTKRDKAMQGVVDTTKARLDAEQYPTSHNQIVVQNAIQKLKSSNDEGHKAAIDTANKRLAKAYF